MNLKNVGLLGQTRYQETSKALSPHVKVASRRQLDAFLKDYYPKIDNFLKGCWIPLREVLLPTFQEIFQVENIVLPIDENHLENTGQRLAKFKSHVWLGYDGSGSHKQLQSEESSTIKVILGT